MTTGDGAVPPLKVDPELLERYGTQLLTAAGNLPAAPPPFVVTGTDPISAAIAEKLPAMEGAFQTELPQLQADATKTASNIVAAAGHYTRTDQQLAADYEKHQFERANAPGLAGAPGTGGGAGSNSMGESMSMPTQMASQAAQLPMQVMGAVTSVPQGIMQGVQQIGQAGARVSGGDQPEDRRDDEDEQAAEKGAAGRDSHAERAPESELQPVAPQQNSPRYAAADRTVDL